MRFTAIIAALAFGVTALAVAIPEVAQPVAGKSDSIFRLFMNI